MYNNGLRAFIYTETLKVVKKKKNPPCLEIEKLEKDTQMVFCQRKATGQGAYGGNGLKKSETIIRR